MSSLRRCGTICHSSRAGLRAHCERVTSDTQDFSNVVTLVLDLVSQILLVIILVVWLGVLNIWLTLL